MKLLTSGCSFVEGDELLGFETNTHHQFTFTQILADKLGAEPVNRGMCGSCNDRIERSIVEYLADPDTTNPTHIVVLWSAWQRNEFVEPQPIPREILTGISRPYNATQYSNHRTHHIYNKRTRKLLQSWYDDGYTSHTDLMHGLTKMLNMQLLCDGLGIKLIQGVFHQRCMSNMLQSLVDRSSIDQSGVDLLGKYKDWIKRAHAMLRPECKVGLGYGRDMYSMGIANNDIKEHGHPGEKTNAMFAEFLFEEFQKLG